MALQVVRSQESQEENKSPSFLQWMLVKRSVREQGLQASTGLGTTVEWRKVADDTRTFFCTQIVAADRIKVLALLQHTADWMLGIFWCIGSSCILSRLQEAVLLSIITTCEHFLPEPDWIWHKSKQACDFQPS